MPSDKRSSRSGASASRSRTEEKFIPNFTQLKESLASLPDPEEWMEESYTCRITADGKRQSLIFAKLEIKRGSSKVARWVYEGKVLIRNRDV